jgi:hypothetical protein
MAVVIGWYQLFALVIIFFFLQIIALSFKNKALNLF